MDTRIDQPPAPAASVTPAGPDASPPAPAATTPPVETEPALTPEQATTNAQASLGVEFTDTFTMREALAAYNATREDIKHPVTGEVILEAAKQQLPVDEEWLAPFAGTFKLRKAGFYDEMAMRVRYCELTRNLPVDPGTAAIVQGTVVAETLLVEKPKGLDLAATDDLVWPILIHNWYEGWTSRFRGKVRA